MKKFLVWLGAVFCFFAMCLLPLSGCKKEEKIAPYVIVATAEEDGKTLEEVMTARKNKGEGKPFTFENGMLVKLDGRKNGNRHYWMLFTSDAQSSNCMWGTYRLGDQTLGSATVGATELIVKVGETYLWSYEKF